MEELHCHETIIIAQVMKNMHNIFAMQLENNAEIPPVIV